MDYRQINDFLAFVDGDIASAVAELKIVAEPSRKHLQKLVYTNVVNRFDSTVDHLFLDNSLEEPMLSEMLEKLDDPLSEGKVLRLISMSEEDVSGYIRGRAQNVLRNGILRERHSKKLRKLFEVFSPSENCDQPRVNPSTGSITGKFKLQIKTIPCSIPGYADWLYCRRNALVHGGRNAKMLSNDITQVQKLYGCKLAANVRIKIGSIRNAVRFYREALAMLKAEN